jgi:hypothetical protein
MQVAHLMWRFLAGLGPAHAQRPEVPPDFSVSTLLVDASRRAWISKAADVGAT